LIFYYNDCISYIENCLFIKNTMNEEPFKKQKFDNSSENTTENSSNKSNNWTIFWSDTKNLENTWKETDNSWKRSENASIKMIKEAVENKVAKQKEYINVKSEEVDLLMSANLMALKSEKKLYEWMWNNELVTLIDKKIATYEANKEIVQSWKVPQAELNKLFSVFNRDSDHIKNKWNSETKKATYSRFIEQISLYNWRILWNKEKLTEIWILNQEVINKKSVDNAINSIQKDLGNQINDLRRVAKELEVRWNDEDLIKMATLLKHTNAYESLLLKLQNEQLSESQKKGLILFSQNDEERHKFMTERMVTADYTYENLLQKSFNELENDFDNIPEWFFADGFDKMLNEETIRLFEFFANKRSLIPGMWDTLPTDDIMAVYEKIKDKLTDNEKWMVEDLLSVQKDLKEFETIKKDITGKYLGEIFNEKEMGIEYQLKLNAEFRDSELAKIDMLSISDQEKQVQKERILEWFAEVESKYRKELSRIAKEKETVMEVSQNFKLWTAEMQKYSGNMSIYSLTADTKWMISILEALAYETMEGRGIGMWIDIDISKIKDYTLNTWRTKHIEMLKDKSKNNKHKMFFNNVSRTRDLLLWSVGETKYEKLDRYKKIDTYIEKSVRNWAWGVILGVYQLFESIINWIENLPKYIAATKTSIENAKMWIFIMALLIVALLCFQYEPSWNTALIELNTKMYSFATYVHDWNGTMSFSPNGIVNYSKIFITISLAAFLIALIVMYSILIEIMWKYIDFLKNSEDKNNIEQIMLSLWKTVIFFLYLWLIFKLFI